MSKFICLQSGHEGRTSGSTGAPGEVELNVRIRNRLSDILIEKGFMIQLVGADPINAEINKDFDLFLALHGDADIYGTGGGVVDFPEPNTDGATIESQRIAKCITEEYFKHSEIVNHPERSNANTRYYYMWDQLTLKTPCVIIEMGVVRDAHDSVLLADTERIATALARGVCKAFDVTYDTPLPAPEPEPIPEPEPESPTESPETPVETPNPCFVQDALIKRIREIVFGRKWFWTKISSLKKLLS